MPNQENFPDSLNIIEDKRPSRVSDTDNTLIQVQSPDGDFIRTNMVFGQTLRDVIEFYVYDSSNEIIAHANIRANDPALRLISFTSGQPVGEGQDNTPDFLQIDLVSILNRLEIPIGRYSIAVNFLRDEVGREADANETKLYITEISPSRTELKIQPVLMNDDLTEEIREFMDPSVPRFVAQAIIDQTFGIALDIESPNIQTITLNGFVNFLRSNSSVIDRLDYANLEGAFYDRFEESLALIRDRTLDLIAQAPSDLQMQNYELQTLVNRATREILVEMVSAELFDPRIQLINSRGEVVTPNTTPEQL